MSDKLTNADIAELKFAFEHKDDGQYAEGDKVNIYFTTQGMYELHCKLHHLAPKILAYFLEQSKCDGCDGTGLKKL